MKAFVLKKRLYGESDFIVTFFTRENGKISGIARNAKKSKKRFGGRLELFNLLDVDIRQNENRFNTISDVSILNSFQGIMNSLETFMVCSFILEHVDIFSSEGEPAERLFDATANSFQLLEDNQNILPKLLSFQLATLSESGYEPDFGDENITNGNLRLSDGKLVESSIRVDNKNVFEFHIDIIRNPQTMEIFLSKVATNIKVLTKYIEYHTGKQFKTSKFLEDLNL